MSAELIDEAALARQQEWEQMPTTLRERLKAAGIPDAATWDRLDYVRLMQVFGVGPRLMSMMVNAHQAIFDIYNSPMDISEAAAEEFVDFLDHARELNDELTSEHSVLVGDAAVSSRLNRMLVSNVIDTIRAVEW